MPVQSSGMRAVESQAIGPPNLEHESNLLDAAERRRLDTGHTTFMTKGEVSHEEFERDVLKLVGGPVPAEGTVDSRRILVVDDDDSIREVAQMSLEMVGGHKVLTAACGADGLASARIERPDAILLDVMTPDLDGPATFERLQADPATREIPVILLTAKLQPADRTRFAELGVRAVVAKPFDPMTLPDEVVEILGWPR